MKIAYYYNAQTLDSSLKKFMKIIKGQLLSISPKRVNECRT